MGTRRRWGKGSGRRSGVGSSLVPSCGSPPSAPQASMLHRHALRWQRKARGGCRLWNTYHAKEHVEPACRRSLSDFGLDYFDLYLVHFPISLRCAPIPQTAAMPLFRRAACFTTALKVRTVRDAIPS
mmetsp:Transcript_23658/g.57062  ORF Transcript_23658/g.57062 Transcript_23658/m.57062 type:complete len:127 (-) Transcript_23658:187-567(-)